MQVARRARRLRIGLLHRLRKGAVDGGAIVAGELRDLRLGGCEFRAQLGGVLRARFRPCAKLVDLRRGADGGRALPDRVGRSGGAERIDQRLARGVRRIETLHRDASRGVVEFQIERPGLQFRPGFDGGVEGAFHLPFLQPAQYGAARQPADERERAGREQDQRQARFLLVHLRDEQGFRHVVDGALRRFRLPVDARHQRQEGVVDLALVLGLEHARAFRRNEIDGSAAQEHARVAQIERAQFAAARAIDAGCEFGDGGDQAADEFGLLALLAIGAP